MPGKSHKIAESRVTRQGQISVPSEVRRRLGIGSGSIIEWNDDGERVSVRRAARCSSSEVHEALFPHGVPKRRSLEDLKAGIRAHVRRRHARR